VTGVSRSIPRTSRLPCAGGRPNRSCPEPRVTLDVPKARCPPPKLALIGGRLVLHHRGVEWILHFRWMHPSMRKLRRSALPNLANCRFLFESLTTAPVADLCLRNSPPRGSRRLAGPASPSIIWTSGHRFNFLREAAFRQSMASWRGFLDAGVTFTLRIRPE
jgi:hypothetical protein